MSMTKTVSAIAMIVVASVANGQQVIHVDDDAPPNGDGMTWPTAFNDLQDALAAAAGMGGIDIEIRVAQGTYKPALPDGDREATFQLINNVALRGGYAGFDAPDPDARDIDLYQTILSGDLNADDIGDFSDPSRLNNSYHVIDASGTQETTLIDGLTIRNGHDERDFPNGFGGGVLIDGGSPSLANCAFTRNFAMFGGGLSAVNGSHLVLSASTFVDNAGDLGGALLVFSSSSAVIDWCDFDANSAMAGGAIFTQNEPDVWVSNCRFEGNSATDGCGGAMFNGGFSGIQGFVFISQSEFIGNSATGDGAGVANFQLAGSVVTDAHFANNLGRAFYDFFSDSVIVLGSDFLDNVGGGAKIKSDDFFAADCLFSGNTSDGLGGGAQCSEGTLINCVFINNTAATFGGGLSIDGNTAHLIGCTFALNHSTVGGGAIDLHASESDWRITNCSIAENSTSGGGGGIRIAGIYNTLHVANSILWSNTDSTGATFQSQIDFGDQNVRVDYSCVQELPDQVSGSGNIVTDPLFVEAAVGNLRLAPLSPCIDAAANTIVPHDYIDLDSDEDVFERIPLDVLGMPRFIDDANVPDSGVGGPRVVDMGAIEHFAECNGNGVPDEIDIAQGTSQDCNGNGIPDECEPSPDCNGNGTCDDEDIAAGTSQDCDASGVPDECEADCNGNGRHDSCDIADNLSEDCNLDGVPDECLDAAVDCDNNGLIDACEIAMGTTDDRNDNGRPDACEPAILYVDVDAEGWNNGLRWQDAFVDLQNALTVARESAGYVHSIWVSEGVYSPAPPGIQRELSFDLVDGVAIYGGFSGSESNIGQRDFEQYSTVLSGDLNGDDTGELLDFTRLENSFHVLRASGLGPDTSLDGFIVRSGMANGGGYWRGQGGGMLATSGIGRVANCVFEGNVAAHHGGGVYANGVWKFDHCRFEDNLASRDYGWSQGGGAFCDGNVEFTNTVFFDNHVFSVFSRIGAAALVLTGSCILRDCELVANVALSLEDRVYGGALSVGGESLIENCLFTNNAAVSENDSTYGGAIRINFLSTATVRDCVFRGNEATNGGAIESCRCPTPLTRCQFISNSAWRGGAICSSEETRVFDGCSFFGNSAQEGGAMYLYDGQQTVRNSAFSGNIAGIEGGAVFARREESSTTFENCTFAFNAAATGGAIFNEIGAQTTIRNAILWGNVPQQLVGTYLVSFSDIDGSWPGVGNIDLPPEFVDPTGPDGKFGTEDDDVRLLSNSPAINAGDPASVFDPGATDLDGHARLLCGRVDMGAYEFGIGDYECDGDVDLFDLAFWENCFTGPENGPFADGCEAFDFDGDGDVDFGDWGGLQAAFNGS